MPLTPGSSLGHYDVTALIGEGGMGQVYRTPDTKLNRQVALKILPEAFAADPDRRARFQREAHVLATGDVTRLGLAGVSPRYVSTGHLVCAAADGSVRAVPFDVASLTVTGSPIPLLEGVSVKATGAANFSISDNERLVLRRA